MYTCKFCERKPVEGWVFNSTWCVSCRKLKHYINLYGDRVHEICDSVLSRDIEKQNNKINNEIKKEIEYKEKKIKNGIDKLDYDKPLTRSKTTKS